MFVSVLIFKILSQYSNFINFHDGYAKSFHIFSSSVNKCKHQTIIFLLFIIKIFSIGICGGSASGKTTVARKIIEELDVPWVTLLSLDSFYKVMFYSLVSIF